MTDDEVDEASETMFSEVCNHRAMRPGSATQQQSLDFLLGLRADIDNMVAAIKGDMADDSD